MNTLSITILATGFACLAIGLGLYILNQRRKYNEYFHSTNVICWILIALFPALVIFSLFPQNTVTGSIFGFSMTGAVALFVFIWWFGTRNSQKAIRIDELNEKLRALEEDLRKSQQFQSESTSPALPRVLTQTEVISFPLKSDRSKKIVLVTGNVQGVKCADVWVNSENTNMQMSRFYERSISGTIRYLGARKDLAGDVIDDLIMRELTALMGSKSSVQPATILVTNSGELKKTHNVKKIFHVAAVRGQVGAGYQPINNMEYCVKNALAMIDEKYADQCKTILFPLLGTGTAKANPNQIVSTLVMAAIEYFETNENTAVEAVYFLAWTDRDLEACRHALGQTGRVVVAD
jgi:O-acetyl-ADP-ribose deacetylase (regulator of RNase III)